MAIHNPRARGPSNLKNLKNLKNLQSAGPSDLRTLSAKGAVI